MHENVRANNASVVLEYLQDVVIPTLDWPPRSLFLNSIEQYFNMLKIKHFFDLIKEVILVSCCKFEKDVLFRELFVKTFAIK